MATTMRDRLAIPLGPIKSTSFSALDTYEHCPNKAKLKYVDRIPEPEHMRSEAADRGTRVHSDAEHFVEQAPDQKMKPLASELRNFTAEMWKLREWFPLGAVMQEDEWAFRRDWTISDWRDKDTWLRMKLDVLVFLEGDHLLVVDHKTGRRYEIKHNDQGYLYALATLLRYPSARKITVEFWYHDKDDLSRVTYTPQQIWDRWAAMEKRLDNMTTATKFPARPSHDNCKYCPYRKEEHGGTGHCQHSVMLDPLAVLANRKRKSK